MAEPFYIMVRLWHDLSMKEPNEEQASRCFPRDIRKVRGPRPFVGKAQRNHQNFYDILSYLKDEWEF